MSDDSFIGVNRAPRVQLLVLNSVELLDWNYCGECQHLDQGNDHCALFNMRLGRDSSAECGHGWYRTTQCKEAECLADLFRDKTTAMQRGAAVGVANYSNEKLKI